MKKKLIDFGQSWQGHMLCLHNLQKLELVVALFQQELCIVSLGELCSGGFNNNTLFESISIKMLTENKILCNKDLTNNHT